MLNKVHHIAIIVSNYEVSKDFYVNKLEFPIVHEVVRKEKNDVILIVQLGTTQLEIFGMSHPPKRISNPEACGLRHLAFYVDDIEKTVEWLETKGIKTEDIRIDPITNKKFTFFRDPDNLPIEIHE